MAATVGKNDDRQTLILLHAIAHEMVDAYQTTLQQLSTERAQNVVNRYIGEILAETAKINVRGLELDEVICSIRDQFKSRLGVDMKIIKVTQRLLEVHISLPFCSEIHHLLRKDVRNCMFALTAAGAFKQKFPNARLAKCELTEDGAKCHISL